MKLFEIFIYSVLLFIATYIFVSMPLRLFELTSSYNSHLIGGISAIVLGMGLFLYLLLTKTEIKSHDLQR